MGANATRDPVADRRCVAAFHLAVIEAIALSRANNRAEISIMEIGPGDYESVRQFGTNPNALFGRPVCSVRAPEVTVAQRQKEQVTPADAPTVEEWSEHTFGCIGCRRVARASKEAIASQREAADCEGMTDAEVAASFEYCLSCIQGPVEGEHVGPEALTPAQIRALIGSFPEPEATVARLLWNRLYGDDDGESAGQARIQRVADQHDPEPDFDRYEVEAAERADALEAERDERYAAGEG